MKNLKSVLSTLAIMLIFTANVNAQKAKKIDVKKSKIEWVGKKLTGSHKGTIDFESGSLTFLDKQLIGGKFVVAMNTINTTDLIAKSKDKLDQHLKSADFFNTKEFPTASLEFTSVEQTDNADIYKITADLIIKDISHPVIFDLKLNKLGATTLVIVNRTLYDIKYASTGFGALADKAINDDFELHVALVY